MLDHSDEVIPGCVSCTCKSPMFDLLDEQELDLVNRNKITIHFKTGETIRKQGTPMSHVLSINTGMAKLYIEGKNQKHTIVRIIKPTNFIGGPGMYIDQVHHYSISALKDSTVCFIEMQTFKRIIFQNKAFNEEFMKDFSQNILLVYNRLINLTQKQIPGRMADSLLYLFEDVFGSDKTDMHFSKQDLADLAGISKDSCIKILREFQDDRIIEYNSHGIELLNPQGLKKISQTG
jgi:CRP/FNR family transcriptional regulator, polysaccharide utilization system transcription regulator